MREIIEIDKDFNLNSVKHSKKIKPNSKIKGKVNISLYDENKNLVRDIHTENLIMDWFKDETYERGFVDLIGRNTFKDSNFVVSPFSYLILSDQDIEESSKDPFILKNAIGYAQRRTTYSGSDTLKGTYNSNESSTYEDGEGNLVCHEVYDFPTHACNGTINSLMWCPSATTDITIKSTTLSAEGFASDKSIIYSKENDRMYYMNTNNFYGYADYKTKEVVTINQLKNHLGSTIGSSSNLYSELYIDYKNNRILGSIYNHSSSAVSSIPSKSYLFAEWDMETGGVKNSNYKIFTGADLTISINGESYKIDRYGFYDGEGYIYYTVYKSTDDKYKGIVKADFETGSMIDNYLFDYPCSSSSVYSKIVVQNDSKFRFLCSDIDCIFNFNLNLLNTYTPARSSNLIAGFENARFYRSSKTQEIRLLSIPATTYVKLAQPIMKTNTNTMKVQYDFIIEQPKVALKLMKEM